MKFSLGNLNNIAASRSKCLYALSTIAIINTLLLCVILGSRRESQQLLEQSSMLHNSSRQVKYGQFVPNLNVKVASLQPTQKQAKSKNLWTLLVFIDPTCPPCADELNSLSKANSTLKKYVNVQPVFTGQPSVTSTQQAALRYREKLGIPFPISVDPDAKLRNMFGTKLSYPYSVLLDPDNRVRLAVSGHKPTDNNSSQLADSLMCFFTGSSLKSVLFTQWHHRGSLSDHPVILRGGQKTTILKLSKNRTLVVTFLNNGDLFEASSVKVLRRYAEAPKSRVRFLFILANKRAKPTGLGFQDGFLVEENASKLFAAYAINRGPVSMIVHNGKIVVTEENAQTHGKVLEDEVAYAVLFSTK